MSVAEKLLMVQKELKAPKNQYNSFGKYRYRSCEDVLEGLKPVLDKYKATVYITDSIELIGDRYYVKSTAKFVDVETGESIENSAFARESADKKEMDSSQVTGATSSYARKYSLNGLFLIDDTKDADSDEYQSQQKSSKGSQKSEPQKSEEQLNQEMIDSVDKRMLPSGEFVTQEQLELLFKEMKRTGINQKTILSFAKVDSFEKIPQATFIGIMSKMQKTPDAGTNNG